MFSMAMTAAIMGIDSQLVTVEADITDGLPNFELVGYLSGEVKEARERVKTAIRNAGYLLAVKKIVVNLSPGDVRKSGTFYDLPIAAAIMCSYGYITQKSLEDTILVGELGLDGRVKSVNGVLPVILMARRLGYRRCIIPADNIKEAAFVDDIQCYGVSDLRQLIDFLGEKILLEESSVKALELTQPIPDPIPDFSDVHGQESLKRACEIAAAGMHNIMFIGPPGCGKTMAARRMAGILPPLTYEERMEVAEIMSVAGLLRNGQITDVRPFRNPHHTITETALAGGGKVPKPGEISLAHRGVLFLDEFTEYSRNAMELLRMPMENGMIRIDRMSGSCMFPADFMLVAAINPCKCGFFPDRKKCSCTPLQIQRFIGRISQPIMDRIDMHVELKPVDIDKIQEEEAKPESSASIRERVLKAREIQLERYKGTGIVCNSQLTDHVIETYCRLETSEKQFMKNIYKQYDMSTRSYHKVLKVARTIADLRGSQNISENDLSEAVFYKTLDAGYWRISYGGKNSR